MCSNIKITLFSGEGEIVTEFSSHHSIFVAPLLYVVLYSIDLSLVYVVGCFHTTICIQSVCCSSK